MYEKSNSSWFKHIDFILLDIICLEIAYFFAFRLRNFWIIWIHGDVGAMEIGLSSAHVHMVVAVLFLLIDIIAVFVRQPYKDIIRRGYLVEFINVCIHNAVILAGMLLYLYITREAQDLSRAVFFLTGALSVIFMYITHIVWKNIVRKRIANDGSLPQLLVVASREKAEQLIQDIHERKYNEFQIGGVVILDADMKGQKVQGENVVSNRTDMFSYVLENVVDAILLSENEKYLERDVCVKRFLSMGQTVHIDLSTISTELPNKMVQQLGNLTVLTTSIKAVDGRALFVKRIMDIMGGMVGCLITLLVAIPLAPIIKIQAPGPVFFCQTRVGKNGRKFKLYKFRSMYIDAEERKVELMEQNQMQGQMFKLENDPRIFPAGHFIRKYSIDELPQFYNILKGDMSLVGTRPPTVDEYEKYDLHHKVRLSIKPGLTGLWQVSGRSNIKDFDEVVQLDETYIQNWNLGLDFRILLRTIKVVLHGEGSM